MKPPGFQAVRCEQIEHKPGQLIVLAERNQRQSLCRVEAIDIEGLQFIERLFKFAVGLLDSVGRFRPPDQGLSIRATRPGIEPLNLPPRPLLFQPVLAKGTDNGA